MPGNVLHVGATVTCSHSGPATPQGVRGKVLVAGQPVVTLADQYTVSACTFNVSGSPHPCVTVRWTSAATRVRVNGSPVLLSGSTGLCLAADQAPQGPPVIVTVQNKVVAQ